jgi:hypothetical protein
LLLLLEGVRRDWLPDDREREPPELLEDPEERDAGGEDVRVAMASRLRDHHTSHRHHTPDLAARRIRTKATRVRGSLPFVGTRA